jgi:hypothetical protein
MKKYFVRFAAFVLMSGGFCADAGELSYVPIPASQSDASSGIATANQYTTALDAGSEGNRVLNGVTLSGSPGSGQNIVASNCSVTASSGNLITTGGATENIQADGTLREVLSDVIYNSDAADNSQQEIVLNPASLTPGATYDLRVYIGKGGNGDRQVNLAFVGDGQAPTETGFFNEDDARSSAGQFQDPTQVYVINYRFVWDGNSAPGITVTQKSGQAPFVLYALTNHPVAGAPIAAAPPAPAQNQGITTGLVTAEADQVGVTSDTFYSNEALNTRGRWVGIKKYGKCWQPNDCPPDWRPYTRGSWRHGDDNGWIWASDASEEEWGWAVFHYGRWIRTLGVGCGWAWVPGTVWGPGWVSWRKGETPDCTCVGWAPLPPEAACEVGVGVSRWADKTYDIGPDYYTFVHVRDFGSRNYRDCGCVLERKRYVNIVEHTVNITNISYTQVNVNINIVGGGLHVNVYNGGPDFNWCNTEIRRHGGQEMTQVYINRYDDPGMFQNKKFSHHDGNTLTLFAPNVFAQKNTKFTPKVFVNVADSKIGHGWSGINPKIKNDLQTKIADQTKGLTPETTKAELPKDVQDKIIHTGPSSKDPGLRDPKHPSPSASPATVVHTGPSSKDPGLRDPKHASPSPSPATAGDEAVDWRRTLRGDGTDKMPTDPKALASVNALAAEKGVSPETLFSFYAKANVAIKTAEIAEKNPNDPKAVAAAKAAAADFQKSSDVFSAEAHAATNLKTTTGNSPAASPGTATASPGQTATVPPAATATPGSTAAPGATTTASASPTRTFPETYKAPLTLKPVSPTASPSATVTGSASPTRTFPETYKAPLTLKPVSPTASPSATVAGSASPTRTFPETYKAPLTLKPVSPTASPSATVTGSASPTRTFPETYKAPLALKSVTPGATATPAATASPTRTFPETYKAPLTLKSVTPAPSVSPSASPTRTFPETYKAPLTLKSVTPAPSVSPSASPTRTFPETYKAPLTLKSVTPAPTASPTRSVPETFHQTTPLPSASPKVIRSVGPTVVPTIGNAWTSSPTPQPTIMSTPKATPIKTPLPATATPRPTIIPNAAVDAAEKAAANTKAQQQLNQQKVLQQQQLKQQQDAATAKANADAAAKANAAAAAKANAAAAAAKAQQQQQLNQQKQQDAAAAKANAAAAAKANAAAAAKAQQQQQLLQQQKLQQQQLQQQQLQQQQLRKVPKPTPTPTGANP